MTYRNILMAVIAAAAVTAACVPAKKYREAEQASEQYRAKADECKVDVDLLKRRIKQLQSDMDKLKAEKNALEQDTTLVGMKNRTLLNRLAILENDLRMLAAKMGDSPEYRALMKHLLQMQDELVDSEGKRLDTEMAIARQAQELAATENALAESERMLQQSSAELANKNEELEYKSQELQDKNQALADARRSIEEQAARLREMEAALRAKDSAMVELRNTIAGALTDFSSDDLTVYQKDGKVYVSLEEKLLFASGKYDVNEKGVSALKKIASVLAQHPELNIVVEGHTDNVPYRGQILIDNWDLSVKRATSVVRILLSSAQLPAKRVQATGRADSSPIDSANTAEARRKNRRTEIILAPNIDSVMSILTEK